ncbi:Mov34/MPN/PAD-1 family protein [Caballeronia sp. NK8]|uniref:Mov34/MPN/PAD-1 family protein n=1 Tax=Caballeronia sp. NK8 TaxID=140098 RepID=UPI001CEC8962
MRVYPLETGGALTEYIAENGEPVVQHIVGPRPSAQHKRHRFRPDHDWQRRRLDEIFETSSGRAVYLGDWHTHPDGSPRMSWLDRRTLRGIPFSPGFRRSACLLAYPL